MFFKIKSKYDKVKAEREERAIEREREIRIKERNKAFVNVARNIAIVLCLIVLGYYYMENQTDFKSFVEDNFIWLLIPFWCYLLVLLILESTKAVIEIIILGFSFAFLGFFAFVIAAIAIMVIEELLSEIGDELIS